jgi:hypothetical protein
LPLRWKIAVFGSLDIRSDQGWRHLESAVAAICAACLDSASAAP